MKCAVASWWEVAPVVEPELLRPLKLDPALPEPPQPGKISRHNINAKLPQVKRVLTPYKNGADMSISFEYVKSMNADYASSIRLASDPLV